MQLHVWSRNTLEKQTCMIRESYFNEYSIWDSFFLPEWIRADTPFSKLANNSCNLRRHKQEVSVAQELWWVRGQFKVVWCFFGLFLILRGWREREREKHWCERETSIVASHTCPNGRPNPHVPWPDPGQSRAFWCICSTSFHVLGSVLTLHRWANWW